MDSLLNQNRPPVFCPGCAHERIVKGLDTALGNMDLSGNRVVIVSDIGCSGLFDVFFNTHAFHGLHGRALTYAAGIKMARPDLTVIVTMGDGGLGIGGAHVLSACRRNLDLTLLILNNFNYGMTGGQCSSTTPNHAHVGSGFLNQLEKPLDICRVADAAGAVHVTRKSSYDKDLPEAIEAAIRFDGFSLMDLHGICPGRYTRRNRLTPKMIADDIRIMPETPPYSEENTRKEYGKSYRETAGELQRVHMPMRIEPQFSPLVKARREVVILGGAGQRIVTAGELFCLAGITAGLHASQKNDYPITVLRGHSVSELILSGNEIGYTGIENPSVVIALAPEGVNRRKDMFGKLSKSTRVLTAKGVALPVCAGTVMEMDFIAQNIKPVDWALASLAVVARQNEIISPDMLKAALEIRFRGAVLEKSLAILNNIIQ